MRPQPIAASPLAICGNRAVRSLDRAGRGLPVCNWVGLSRMESGTTDANRPRLRTIWSVVNSPRPQLALNNDGSNNGAATAHSRVIRSVRNGHAGICVDRLPDPAFAVRMAMQAQPGAVAAVCRAEEHGAWRRLWFLFSVMRRRAPDCRPHFELRTLEAFAWPRDMEAASGTVCLRSCNGSNGAQQPGADGKNCAWRALVWQLSDPQCAGRALA